MSTRARDWAWQSIARLGDELPPPSRLILLFLAERADDDGECFPGIDVIGKATGMSPRSVRRHRAALADLGLAEFLRRNRPDGTRTSDLCRLAANGGPLSKRPTVAPRTAKRPTVAPSPPAASANAETKRPTVAPRTVEPSGQIGSNQAANSGHARTVSKNRQVEEPTTTLFIVDGVSPNGEQPPKPPKYDHNSDPVFAGFWDVYPLHRAKQAAYKAWRSAIKHAAPALIVAGAQRYRDDPARKPDFTAHPATWLNGERWTDEPAPASTRPDGMWS